MRLFYSVPGMLLLGALSTALAVGMVTRGQKATPAGEVAAKEEGKAETPQAALALLAEGNRRWVDGKPRHPHATAARRKEVTGGQHPFAVVLTCADSRVSPEILFDRGVGDLFVVRTAGQVVDVAALGSLEYAVEHLHTPLLMVLGHTRCGAVQAACDALDKGQRPSGAVGYLIDAIRPSCVKTQDVKPGRAEAAVRANVERIAESLPASSRVLTEFEHEGKLEIVGAEYNLESGQVAVLK